MSHDPGPLALASERKSQDAIARARAALSAMHDTGAPITFQGVAQHAGVSRPWLYKNAPLRAEDLQGSAAQRTEDPWSYSRVGSGKDRLLGRQPYPCGCLGQQVLGPVVDHLASDLVDKRGPLGTGIHEGVADVVQEVVSEDTEPPREQHVLADTRTMPVKDVPMHQR